MESNIRGIPVNPRGTAFIIGIIWEDREILVKPISQASFPTSNS